LKEPYGPNLQGWPVLSRGQRVDASLPGCRLPRVTLPVQRPSSPRQAHSHYAVTRGSAPLSTQREQAPSAEAGRDRTTGWVGRYSTSPCGGPWSPGLRSPDGGERVGRVVVGAGAPLVTPLGNPGYLASPGYAIFKLRGSLGNFILQLRGLVDLQAGSPGVACSHVHMPPPSTLPVELRCQRETTSHVRPSLSCDPFTQGWDALRCGASACPWPFVAPAGGTERLVC